MTGQFTDAGAMVRLAYQAMGKLGIDADAMLAQINFDPEQLYRSELRTLNTDQLEFWQALEAFSQDPHIGLHLGEAMPIYRDQVMEYLFLSSSTFGEGLQRARNYQRLISEVIDTEVQVEGDTASLSLGFSATQSPHFIECLAIAARGFFESVTDGAFCLSGLALPHARHAPMEEYQRIFECPLEFGTESTTLYFDAELLAHRSFHAQPELLEINEQLADQHLAKLEQRELVNRVRQQVANVLESGDTSLDTIAARLQMQPSQLRGRLQQAGTNFNKVVDDYRYKLARQLLAHTEESIVEIVYLTGFSEPSTFYRAFKRWEGTTPVAYRKARRSD